MVTAADHAKDKANTVREALNTPPLLAGHQEALAALDALQAQAETAERMRLESNAKWEADWLAMEAERDAAVQAAEQAHDALQKIQQASTLRNARELAEWELARAALAGNQP